MSSKHQHSMAQVRVVAVALLLIIVGSLTSCGRTWDWLWSRDHDRAPDTNDLILGGNNAVEEEGAVEFDKNKKHAGTEIYYVNSKIDDNPNRARIIVIDAGHQQTPMSTTEPNGPGSTDMKAAVAPGATGVSTGQNEYDLNLRVAIALRNELMDRGYSVVMIRETNNVTISNMERARIANKYKAAAYIRIHANGSEDPNMRGAMTICQSAANPYETCAAHYEESRLLSESVLDAFCETTGFRKLAVSEMDNMTGTNWSEVPTTIIEMGFLSNATEDELMALGYTQGDAADGIANGLDTYFAQMEAIELETTADETGPMLNDSDGDSDRDIQTGASAPTSPRT